VAVSTIVRVPISYDPVRCTVNILFCIILLSVLLSLRRIIHVKRLEYIVPYIVNMTFFPAVRQSDAGIGWELRKEMESRRDAGMEVEEEEEEEEDEEEDEDGEGGEGEEEMEQEDDEASTSKVILSEGGGGGGGVWSEGTKVQRDSLSIFPLSSGEVFRIHTVPLISIGFLYQSVFIRFRIYPVLG
jgi:hypothetical protein